jgi:peptidoglycan/LPS O-acetylase OafA/YrhL
LTELVSKRPSGISSEHLVRAIAIVMVVIHHAELRGETSGGMNVLMMTSGLALARLTFNTTTRATIVAMWRMCIRLAVPALAMVAFFAFTSGEYFWQQFAFVSNLLPGKQLEKFPLWYPEVIVQILILLMPIFMMFHLTEHLRRRPLTVSITALAIALTIAVIDHVVFTPALGAQVPQRHLWNFILGWILWAFSQSDERRFERRLFSSAVLVVAVSIGLFAGGARDPQERIATVLILGLVMIWIDHIAMPELLARPISLIAQASYFIFLLHILGFWYAFVALRTLGLEQIATRPVQTVLSIIGCVTLWAITTALIRAKRRLASIPRSTDQPAASARLAAAQGYRSW